MFTKQTTPNQETIADLRRWAESCRHTHKVWTDQNQDELAVINERQQRANSELERAERYEALIETLEGLN